MKKAKFWVILLLAFMLFPITAHADLIAGEEIVTLGEDLSATDKEKMLNEFGVSENETEIVYVTNEEEHKYLGEFIPASQIGSNAISSAKITIGNKGDGIVVETKNINYITDDMYVNALATAGIEDAKIQISSPFQVSGTGALTGIIKAYEVQSGEKIDEDQKLVANEEMVLTSDLVKDGVNEDDATEFFRKVKERVSKENPQTDEDIRTIIQEVAKDFGITLDDQLLDKLVNLFKKIKDLNIDWDKVNDTLKSAKDKWDDFVSSEEGKGIIDAIINFFKAIWDWFLSIFSK
ncbi:DUF1002 domain-containing protein [Cerasibacillus terrae]|uniref:DUF1002 domain-containing protein n=1 Tax=Cerasibacillus terrae TaxID=2498845 RepID=A0A5C8NXV0_9BACI|nr:DUF1002 domain-containing protein [Cerasibacillus terrae]TXL65871.1 DUF1002 domain-containing protein [Cerasibacillus terrae]